MDKIALENIPYSTRFYWRKCFKNNENYFVQKNIAEVNIANNTSALNLVNSIIKSQGAATFWKQNKLALQDVLNDKQTEQNANQILEALQISQQAYAHWFPNTVCKNNIFGICQKKYPNQLLPTEVEIIKTYLLDTRYLQWSRTSIYLQMRRDKALIIGKKTFLKYCNQLGFGKKKYKQKCCKNRIGLVATKYLEMIHVDITYYTLGNGKQVYILNVVDNFTRKLLHSTTSETCNSTLISNAIKGLIMEYNLPSQNTKIVFDNGAENNGFTNLLLAQYPSITKIIAKLDTPHANNIVEACHKRFKNEVLPIKHFETFEDLVKDLPTLKENYNNMPHSFLRG
jgi:putative transposase